MPLLATNLWQGQTAEWGGRKGQRRQPWILRAVPVPKELISEEVVSEEVIVVSKKRGHFKRAR